MTRRATLLAAFAVCALLGAPAPAAWAAANACTELAVADPDSGIGGTGHSDPDGGIGGTGHSDPDGGIGGTGHGDPDSGIGGTGVFGTIAGFASICVNGLEIHYGDDVPVRRNGAAASTGDLALGHVVWVVAHEQGGRLVARSIDVLSALVGSVDAFDASAGSLRIAGESIELAPDAIVFDGLAVGVRVDVAGLRRPDGSVVASRIDAAPAELPQLSARLQLEPLLRAAPGLRRVSVEGFAARGARATELSLAGLPVEIPGPAPRPEERVRVDGRLLEGVLLAERWTARPARPEPPSRSPELVPPELAPPDVTPAQERGQPPELPPETFRPEPFDRPELFERPALPVDRPEGALIGQ